MKKILILAVVLVGSYFAWAQSPSIFKPSSSVPTPNEYRLLSGAYGIVDGYHPSYNISIVGTNHTLNDTNSIVIVKNPAATIINHITFPDCTNYRGRWFEVVTAGDRCLAVLTNANSQSFESATNTVTTAGFSVNSNTVVRVISTGTNWFVFSRTRVSTD